MSSICIIIPVYNEEKRLDLDKFKTFFSESSLSFIFVNDGSTDNTIQIITKLSDEFKNVEVLDFKQNRGKAEAVRLAGIEALKKENIDYIGFWDADLSTPLWEIDNFVAEIEYRNNESLAVIGSRIKRLGSNIYRNKKRHLLGRAFATCASWILKVPVYDTQCGAKIFKTEVVSITFKEPFITSWIFDIEIMSRMIKHYGKKEVVDSVVEYPLKEWLEVDGSKLKMKDYFSVPFQLLKIAKQHRKK